MITLPKTKTVKCTEWLFEARDIDSGDVITDRVMIAHGEDPEKVQEYLNKYLHNDHPITSISGNTWSVEWKQRTGAEVNKITSWEMVSDRQPQFDKDIYPIMKGD